MTQPPVRVFDGHHLRATLNPGAGQRLLVTFDFRKDGRAGFGTAPRPGRIAARGWDHLHLSTACNDWFLNTETKAASDAMAAVSTCFAAVHLLGYSMGAYGALRFAAALSAIRIVAVSPFVSLCPNVAPWERRHTEDLPHWHRDPELAALPGCVSLGLIVVDPDLAADLAHAVALARIFPGLQLVPLPGGGHPATRTLRETGDNDAILAAALDGDESGALLAAVHAGAHALA